MINMDGNPHVDPIADAVVFSAEDAPLQNVEFLLDNLARATKAIAYEQRTANLITLYAAPGLDSMLPTERWKNVSQDIIARLGLTERTTP